MSKVIVHTMSHIGLAEARNPFWAGASYRDFLEVVSKLVHQVLGLVQTATSGHVGNDA
jgi:hypothetical protein